MKNTTGRRTSLYFYSDRIFLCVVKTVRSLQAIRKIVKHCIRSLKISFIGKKEGKKKVNIMILKPMAILKV